MNIDIRFALLGRRMNVMNGHVQWTKPSDSRVMTALLTDTVRRAELYFR